MWTAEQEMIGNARRFTLHDGQGSISFGRLFDLLAADKAFVGWYTELLAGSNYVACFWEHPPIRSSSVNDAAEFVLIDAPMLAGLRGDPDAFRPHFADADDVVIFPNLGGDADLIVPTPTGSSQGYGHLLAYLRSAPAGQIEALWRALGKTAMDALSEKPLWISTSGLGVAWLHIRLDSVPKYYQHQPYKSAA